VKVLLAPDKFKGSASAHQVAQALSRGMSRVRPGALIARHPIADGGEGTVEVLLQHGFRPVSTRVRGPLGDTVTATYVVRDEHAVIEAAAAYGLGLVTGGPTSSTARRCSSFGVGELIEHARSGGARTITVAVGGSAGTDGGAGALQALGASVIDQGGDALPGGGEALARVAVADLSSARAPFSGIDLVVACDVDNPLLGHAGAAAVYAAQKGASPADVGILEDALTSWAHAVATETGQWLHEKPGAGAAGGLAFGLAAIGARIVSGLETMLDLTGFTERLEDADLVVVAEGTLDEQSLHGKGPIGIARAAARVGVPVIAVAGRCTLTAAQQRSAGLRAVHTLATVQPDPVICMRDAELLLEEVGASLATTYLIPNPTGGESQLAPGV
jgi:glycerate 2-kinase